MLEMGAGGGSIGRVDDLGFLKVGPKSAGATPGPASYDLGGEEPTVTDANLLLGYLSEEATLAGGLKLNRAKAEDALAKVGAKAGLSPHEVAVGIRRIINENMAQAAQFARHRIGRRPTGVYAAGLWRRGRRYMPLILPRDSVSVRSYCRGRQASYQPLAF